MTDCDEVYGLEILNPDDAVTEPVTLAEAKAHLSLADADLTQDTRITALITAARQLAERHTRRQIVPKDLRLSLLRLPREIELPGGVVRSVDQVTYLSAADTWSVANSSLYETLLSFTPPRIVLKPNQNWPYPVVSVATVTARVEYAAGWEDADHVPATIKQAMLLAIGNWFYQRGDDQKAELPPGAICLLDSWMLPQYG